MAIPHLAHCILPTADGFADFKIQRAKLFLPNQIGMLSAFYAHLTPFGQKRKPEAFCILVFVFLFQNSFAQIQPQQTPTFENTTNTSNIPNYTNSKLQPQNEQTDSSPNLSMGSTADDVYKQANKNSSGPTYRAGMTSAEIQQANQEFIMQRMSNDPAYQMPNAKNGFKNLDFEKEKEMMDLLNEINQINNGIQKSNYYNSDKYKTDLPNYQNAFAKLKDMLEGKTPISIADAYYIEESAYGNLQLSYKEYKDNIAQSVNFMKKWMLQNKLDTKNPEAVHLAIQKFMGDELSIKKAALDLKQSYTVVQKHKPFMYDYIDYKGVENLNNYFVTKTLATGTGQCNTLPRAYSVFAEGMGVDASITIVHQHSFIKYKNSKGTIENYETTVDWHMSDNDYMEDIPVMAEAIKNKLYLQPFSKKQMIASAIIDLAHNFHREHWMSDGKFMNETINYAMTYFPNEAHREGLLLKNLLLASQLDIVLHKNNITDLNDVSKNTEAENAYKQLRYYTNKISTMGIHDIPDDIYNAMLEKHDSRGKLQQSKKIDTKAKKSLFSTIQTK